jgi:hypothetical protein
MTAYEIYKLGLTLNLSKDEFKKLLIEQHIIVPKMMKNELLKSNIGDVGLFFNDEDEKIYKIGRLKSLSGNSNCEDEDGCYYDNFTPMKKAELISAIEMEFYKLSKKINWNKLREEYFNECTYRQFPIEKSSIKINMSPHDLFEWFKSKVDSNCL